MSKRRQCRLLGISRSSLNYPPKGESAENLALMRRLDELYLGCPFYGSRQKRPHLDRKRSPRRSAPDSSVDATDGFGGDLPEASKSRGPVRTPCLPLSAPRSADRRTPSGLVRGNRIYPFLQRVFLLGRGDRLGQSVRAGVAFVQHDGQRVLCRGSGRGALTRGVDDLQHGSGDAVHEPDFHRAGASVRCSMDGLGRCLDYVFIERLWRSLKYEAAYLRELADGFAAARVIGEWMEFYNGERPRSAPVGTDPTESSPREGAT